MNPPRSEFATNVIAALGNPEPIWAVRRLTKLELEKGRHAEELVEELKAIRSQLDDHDEDVVLELVTHLNGWCSPHLKLVSGDA